MQYFDIRHSPVGILHLVSDGEAITKLWIEGQKYAGRHERDDRQEPHLIVLIQTWAWLERFLKGEQPGDVPPLNLQGTRFQRRVWQVLRGIPYGSTRTYGDIAKQIAREQGQKSMSAQAIGNAVGHNPVSILVPCHRVLGADGRLTGYAGGIDAKRKLLEIEQANFILQP